MQQEIYDLKMQVGQLVSNHQPVPAALVARLRQSTNDPDIGAGPSSLPFYGTAGDKNSAISPDYYYNGVYYATVDGGVGNYEEPTSLPPSLPYGSAMYNNFCGPGSATKLLSHYIPSTINSYYNSTFSWSGGTSQQAYMAYLAAGAPDPGGTSYAHCAINANQGMMNKNDPTANYQWNTENGDEANVINQVLGSNYYGYGTDYPGDGAARFNTSQYPLSQFQGQLAVDLEYNAVPMVMTADTWGLQGWPAYPGPHATHLVALNGFNPSNYNLWYFDSASNSSAYGNYVNYFHSNWPINTVIGGWSGLIDDVW